MQHRSYDSVHVRKVVLSTWGAPMMPKQVEIEIPFLKCLEELGGQAKPPQIYSAVRKFFPHLAEADLAETLSSGGNKWTNRVQWVRQRLISKGEVTSPAHGVWAITDRGRAASRSERFKSPNCRRLAAVGQRFGANSYQPPRDGRPDFDKLGGTCG